MKDELTQRGVTFITKSVGSIEEAAGYGDDESILINATGLGILNHCKHDNDSNIGRVCRIEITARR